MYNSSQVYHQSLIVAPANLANCDGRTLHDSSFSVSTFHQTESIDVQVSSPLKMVEKLREQAMIQSLRILLNPGPAPHRTHPIAKTLLHALR